MGHGIAMRYSERRSGFGSDQRWFVLGVDFASWFHSVPRVRQYLYCQARLLSGITEGEAEEALEGSAESEPRTCPDGEAPLTGGQC